MEDLTKKALSLANKDGQRFIKMCLRGKRIIGIEDVDYSSNWFLVIYEYIEYGGQNKGMRKVMAASISGYWSGGAKSTFYGDMRHVGRVHAENRMLKLFGKRYAHQDRGFYQCEKAKRMELNRKYNYEPKYAW